MKILHIAPQNFAGMPLDFVNMHRENGIYSRLITLYRNTLNFDEDITLDLPLPTGKTAKKWRDKKVYNTSIFCEPKNIFESVFFQIRDFKNKNRISEIINAHKLYDYDIYHFDGGMDFFRDVRFARTLKKIGKKIVCCYFGSDLRSRGLIRELDSISDLNLTVEYDHLSLHKNINYIFFPFDTKSITYQEKSDIKIQIIHSPTNRLYKGTEKILKIIEVLKRKKDFDFILAENMDRNEVLKIKTGCNLAIDQVGGERGGTGYGKNSIENLAMGIPTITEFTPDYLKFIPENPFIHCSVETLEEEIIKIIENPSLLHNKSKEGKEWVEKYHSYKSVNCRLMDLYKTNNIIL